MNPVALTDRDEPKVSFPTPHLSHARISRYLHCPEQYRLYYIENLRPKYQAASLVFGQAVHQALAALFREQHDPVQVFLDSWREVGEVDLSYGSRESWEKYRDTGEHLLGKFVQEELPRVQNASLVEKVFTLNITNLDIPFVGVIDLVAEFNGKRTVIDFKTAASSFDKHEAVLSDQLTAYRLAEPEAAQVALCVLVKTKTPKIEWHLTNRTADQLTRYLTKVGLIGGEITAGRFYRRPGKWCAWCDYLPVCTGDSRKVKETLVRIEERTQPGGGSNA